MILEQKLNFQKVDLGLKIRGITDRTQNLMCIKVPTRDVTPKIEAHA